MAIIKPEQLSSGSYNITGSFAGSFTGSLFGTASYATQALSSSFATTASFASIAPITIGTTPITSGVAGRVLFEGAGNVVGQNTNFSYIDNCLNLSQYPGGTTRQLYLAGGRSVGMDVAWGGTSTTAVRIVNSGDGTNTALLVSSFNGTTNNALYASNGNITVLNGNIHIGNHTNAARLDVRAQGALSTDVAFRVRNSANTADLLNVAGNGAITGSRINLYTDGASQPRAELGASNVVSSYGISSILGNSNTINLQSGGRANVIGSSNTVSGGTLSVNVIGSGNSGAGSGLVMIGSNNSNHYEKANTVIIGSRIKMPSAGARPYQIKIGTGGNVSTSDIQGSFQLYLNNTDNSDLFLSNKTNLVLSNQTFIAGGTHFEVNATNTVTTHNGVAPTTNILNAFQQYSADIVAGNAAPHFRTENGSIIKLYQQSAVTSSQGLADVLTNVGLLSGSSVIAPTFPYTGSAEITGSLTVTGSVAGAVQTLSIVSSTASLDLSRGNFFELNLESGSVTHLSPTNIQPGQTINLKITQPTTSGSLTYDNTLKFPGGIPYSASATGSVTDIVSLISFDSTTLYATAIKNLS